MRQPLLSGVVFLTVLIGGCIFRPAPEANSPQKEPTVEDIHFSHGKNRLSGSLFLPDKPGPHPAVALVLGSDPADRTYGGTGTALCKHFAQHGVACLSWDKPGVGRSTGDHYAQTLLDRAGEALAAVAFLRGRADIRKDHVGLWGHSQGGMVAPMAASLSGDVAFLIEVSGWQGPVWQQDAVRVGAELRADGFPEADVEQAVAFAKRRMDLIRGTGPFEELDNAQVAVLDRPWFVAVHRCDRALFYSARRNVGEDTEPYWEKVRCPVLAIYGDKDVSSGAPEPLVAVIRRGLAKAGNKDLTVRIFADANHSLCKAKTGGPKEALKAAKAQRKGDPPNFVPGYLDAMTNWLAEISPTKAASSPRP
jgi:pimeloyl-ACP methyl ester carboxylesterase